VHIFDDYKGFTFKSQRFRRQGGKGKITGGLANATLRIFWPFQRGSTEFAADRSRRLLSDSLLVSGERLCETVKVESFNERWYDIGCKAMIIDACLKSYEGIM